MCKQKSCLTILFITTLLLTSCATPALAPTPNPTAAPTLLVTTCPSDCISKHCKSSMDDDCSTFDEPDTVAQTKEAYSVEKCEELLESITGTDVEYNSIEDDKYKFEDEDFYYFINMTNGHLELCISKIKDKNNAIQSLSLEDAKNIGTSDIKRFFPNFFDFAIQYKSDIGENDYNIEMYQISPLGRKTGNTANISFSKDGLHYSFMISNNEDPAIVDRAYKISKEKAQEIAYKVCKEEIKTEQIKDADIKICVNKANLTVVKSKQVWVICIKMKNTDHCCTCYNICIDANTGEVLKIVKHL